MVARKIGRATAVVTFAGLLGRVGSFVGSLVMVRRLGIEALGTFGLIESWLTLGMMFTLFGLPNAATRHLAVAMENDPAEVRPLMQASTLLTLLFSLVIAIAGGIWLHLDSNSSSPAALLAPYRLLVVTLLLLYTLRGLLTSFVYGLQSYSVLINANIAVGIAAPLLTLWLVSAGNVAAALGVRILLTAVEVALLLPPILHSWQRVAAPQHSLQSSARRLLAFGLPTFIGQAAVSPIQTFALTFLAAQPGGIVQVGLIATAQRLLSFVNFLPGSLASTLTPILSAEWGKGDIAIFRDSLTDSIRLSWAATLPIVVGCIAAAPALLGVLFGREYVSATTVTIMLLALMLLVTVNESADRALAASDRMWLSTGNNLVWTLLFTLFAVVLVPRLAAAGYALAYLTSFTLYVALQMMWLRRLFTIRLVHHLWLLTLFTGASSTLAYLISWSTPYLLQGILAAFAAAITLLTSARLFLSMPERAALAHQAQRIPTRLRRIYHEPLP